MRVVVFEKTFTKSDVKTIELSRNSVIYYNCARLGHDPTRVLDHRRKFRKK